MRAEKKIVIRASLAKVYAVAETYPLFVKSFKRREVLQNTEFVSKVRVANVFFGIPLIWEGEGKKKKNVSIEWVQTSGLLTGLCATWLFREAGGEHTEVLIRGEYTANGRWSYCLNRLAPLLVGKAICKILSCLKHEAECQR